jgi:hypothetical protein
MVQRLNLVETVLPHLRRSLLAVVALMTGTVTAHAQSAAERETALFTHPVMVQRVPPKSPGDAVGEIRCTYYPDLMVLETGTDTPYPGFGAIVPTSGGRPACSVAVAQHGVPLKTERDYLIGRMGPYLAFAAADPNGAQDFQIIDAGTGRHIFADSRRWTGFQSVAIDNGALHLRYTRAVNGPCSIVKDGAACWAKMVKSGAIPQEMAQLPPSVQQACAAAYRKGRVPDPPAAPSMVFYDLDVTLDAAGKVRVNSRGAVGCEAVP